MTEHSQELKPCHMPGCPGKPRVYAKNIMGNRMHKVECNLCYFETAWYADREGAITQWNYRPVEDELQAALEAANAEIARLRGEVEAWEDANEEERSIYLFDDLDLPDNMRLQRRRTGQEGN